MKFLVLFTLLFSLNEAFAKESWKRKLSCTSNKFLVEIFPALNTKGTERGVYFAKNTESPYSFVTSNCKRSSKYLICKSSKVEIKLNLIATNAQNGLQAKVTNYSRLIPQTDILNCL